MMMSLPASFFCVRLLLLVFATFGNPDAESAFAWTIPRSRRPASRWSSTAWMSTTTSTSTETSSLSSPSPSSSSIFTSLLSGEIPYTSLDQADRSLCYGIQLEKNGQARKAFAALHEAATLYQCFLAETKSREFAHVTCASQPEATALLGYTCLRLAFLNHDALGDPKAAVRLYKEAATIDPQPSAYSWDGMGQSIEASSAGRELPQAIAAYTAALQLVPNNRKILFHKAVAMERYSSSLLANSNNDEETKGRAEDMARTAQDMFEQLRREESTYACWVDSWGYVRWHTRKVPCADLNLLRGTRDMLELALHAALPLVEHGGLVAEFGVGGGRSLRMTQELLPLDVPIHGFDTFTGLPQAWGNEPAGAYSTGGVVPNLEGEVYFHKGLFRDTIPRFLEQAGKDAFLAYANIDCDLYSSTLDVLEAFHGRVVVGTVLVFDEYMGHPTWRQDEFRAWRECCKRFGWKYEYLGFSLATKQAVVRVIDA